MSTITETTRSYSVNEVSAMAKAILKKAFPKTKFSVRGKKYSGGSSITAYWTDGPTSKQVEALIGHLEGASFDGMQDLKTYNDPDTVIQNDGTVVHITYGNDYMFTGRTISQHDTLKAQCLDYIRAHCALNGDAPHERFGNEWIGTVANRMLYASDLTNGFDIEKAFRVGVLREEA